MLAALSLWGLMHMAGGGVPMNGSVLYNLPLIPIIQTPDYMILKYDQFVHAYGFGVTAWVLWHLLRRHFPQTEDTWTILVFPALGAMGLGAVNEIIEFIAVLSVPDTNVGGYINTALDLCFNALGAVLAGRTAIVIAHRLRTAETADRVVLMDTGRVIAIGSHAELAADSPSYGTLVSIWERGIAR